MKQFSLRPHFLPMIALLGVLAFTTACNNGPSEFDLRVFKHLQLQNRIDAIEFKDAVVNGLKKIEEQTKSGNMKYSAFIPIYEQLIADHDRVLAQYNRLKSPTDGSILATLSAEALVESIDLALRDWQKATKGFCTNFRDREPQMNFYDPKQEAEPSIKDRFSSSNKAKWSMELELLESQTTVEALEMAHYLREMSTSIICFPMDTLVLLNFTNGNAVEAGEEVGIGLKLVQEFIGIHPEFAGTGRIVTNPGGTTATLYIRTSEDMIPDGQNEAKIPYTSKALVPKADGSIIELRNEGKIKIRRPCKAK